VCRKDLTGTSGGPDDARASSPSFGLQSTNNRSTVENSRNPSNSDEHSTNNQYVGRGRGRRPGQGPAPGNLDTMDFDFD